MNQPGKHDPFELWRDFLNRAEHQLNSALSELTTSPQFSRAQGRVMETVLFLQRNLNETSQRYLSTLNLPTRSDVIGLAERLTAVEDRLGSIEALLRRAVGPSSAAATSAPRPQRTRRPPRVDAAPAEPDPSRAKRESGRKRVARTSAPQRRAAAPAVAGVAARTAGGAAKKQTPRRSAGAKGGSAKPAPPKPSPAGRSNVAQRTKSGRAKSKRVP